MAKIRFASLLLSVCLCRAQTPDPNAGKCRVAGQVVHSVAGTPLRKVQLRLKRFSAGGMLGGVVTDAPSVSNYATVSDAEGKFSFDGVEPGAYWLSAERAGYLDQSYGAREPFLKGSPLKLTAGQRRDDVVMKLTPQSFLYGKVADEDGDLITGAQVQVYKSSWARGKRQFQVAGAANSQDDGSFVVGNLPPGRYYLSATPMRREDGPQAADSKLLETYTTTYYPSVPDAGGAAPVDVAAGAELRGLEIRMRLAHVYRIRGKAVNTSNGGPAAQVNLSLTARDAIGESNTVVNVMTEKDGAFEFHDVAPGDYLISSVSSGVGMLMGRSIVMSLSGGTEKIEVTAPSFSLIGRASVHVADQDIDNLAVPLSEGAVLTGTIRMVDNDPAKPSPWPSLMLTPLNGPSDDPVASEVGADGAFRIEHIIPDRYAIEMAGMPAGVYVKSVKLDGHSVAGDNLDLTAGGGVLEIALSEGGAAIAGVVHRADGEPAAGATIQVCQGDDSVKYAGADENGAYTVDGLAPGDYRVLAWEEVEPGLSQDSSFRARFDAQSATVKLAEHGRSTADLKVISREAIEAEAARLK